MRRKSPILILFGSLLQLTTSLMVQDIICEGGLQLKDTLEKSCSTPPSVLITGELETDKTYKLVVAILENSVLATSEDLSTNIFEKTVTSTDIAATGAAGIPITGAVPAVTTLVGPYASLVAAVLSGGKVVSQESLVQFIPAQNKDTDLSFLVKPEGAMLQANIASDGSIVLSGGSLHIVNKGKDTVSSQGVLDAPSLLGILHFFRRWPVDSNQTSSMLWSDEMVKMMKMHERMTYPEISLLHLTGIYGSENVFVGSDSKTISLAKDADIELDLSKFRLSREALKSSRKEIYNQYGGVAGILLMVDAFNVTTDTNRTNNFFLINATVPRSSDMPKPRCFVFPSLRDPDKVFLVAPDLNAIHQYKDSEERFYIREDFESQDIMDEVRARERAVRLQAVDRCNPRAFQDFGLNDTSSSTYALKLNKLVSKIAAGLNNNVQITELKLETTNATHNAVVAHANFLVELLNAAVNGSTEARSFITQMAMFRLKFYKFYMQAVKSKRNMGGFRSGPMKGARPMGSRKDRQSGFKPGREITFPGDMPKSGKMPSFGFVEHEDNTVKLNHHYGDDTPKPMKMTDALNRPKRRSDGISNRDNTGSRQNRDRNNNRDWNNKPKNKPKTWNKPKNGRGSNSDKNNRGGYDRDNSEEDNYSRENDNRPRENNYRDNTDRQSRGGNKNRDNFGERDMDRNNERRGSRGPQNGRRSNSERSNRGKGSGINNGSGEEYDKWSNQNSDEMDFAAFNRMSGQSKLGSDRRRERKNGAGRSKKRCDPFMKEMNEMKETLVYLVKEVRSKEPENMKSLMFLPLSLRKAAKEIFMGMNGANVLGVAEPYLYVAANDSSMLEEIIGELFPMEELMYLEFPELPRASVLKNAIDFVLKNITEDMESELKDKPELLALFYLGQKYLKNIKEHVDEAVKLSREVSVYMASSEGEHALTGKPGKPLSDDTKCVSVSRRELSKIKMATAVEKEKDLESSFSSPLEMMKNSMKSNDVRKSSPVYYNQAGQAIQRIQQSPLTGEMIYKQIAMCDCQSQDQATHRGGPGMYSGRGGPGMYGGSDHGGPAGMYGGSGWNQKESGPYGYGGSNYREGSGMYGDSNDELGPYGYSESNYRGGSGMYGDWNNYDESGPYEYGGFGYRGGSGMYGDSNNYDASGPYGYGGSGYRGGSDMYGGSNEYYPGSNWYGNNGSYEMKYNPYGWDMKNYSYDSMEMEDFGNGNWTNNLISYKFNISKLIDQEVRMIKDSVPNDLYAKFENLSRNHFDMVVNMNETIQSINKVSNDMWMKTLHRQMKDEVQLVENLMKLVFENVDKLPKDFLKKIIENGDELLKEFLGKAYDMNIGDNLESMVTKLGNRVPEDVMYNIENLSVLGMFPRPKRNDEKLQQLNEAE